MSDKKKGFSITAGKGFHMTFSNGITISVQWGPGNYCDNRHMTYHEEKEAGEKGSDTAEIAIWSNHDNGKEWITRGIYKIYKNENIYDDVVAFVDPDRVADMICICSSLTEYEINKASLASIQKYEWQED